MLCWNGALSGLEEQLRVKSVWFFFCPSLPVCLDGTAVSMMSLSRLFHYWTGLIDIFKASASLMLDADYDIDNTNHEFPSKTQ